MRGTGYLVAVAFGCFCTFVFGVLCAFGGEPSPCRILGHRELGKVDHEVLVLRPCGKGGVGEEDRQIHCAKAEVSCHAVARSGVGIP